MQSLTRVAKKASERLTLTKVCKETEKDLRLSNISLPQLEARILSAHLLNMEPQDIFIRGEECFISEDEYVRLQEMIQLKKQGVPTAYITRKKDFFGRRFFVNEYTLIPRPETEELIELILSELPKEKSIKSLLDVCCGSGCIGISLAFELSIRKIFFSDVCKKALRVAQKNAAELLDITLFQNLKTSFIEADLFSKFSSEKFDLIVSNPPYISKDEMEFLMPSVKNHEPRIALEIPSEDFSTRLVQGAFSHLEEGGKFYMEYNPLFISDIRQNMKKTGFREVEIKYDLSGKKRFLRGTR